MSLRFRPPTVLIFSLSGALLYGASVTWRFPGGDLTGQYVYVVPIVVPFVGFLFDRLSEIGEVSPVVFLVDALVVGTAMMRVVAHVPFVSGHALFLTYAIVRPGSLVTRITAVVVLLEVVYLKYFVWHDLVTSSVGITLGLLAGLIVRWICRMQLPESV